MSSGGGATAIAPRSPSSQVAAPAVPPFDVAAVRAEFPGLAQEIDGRTVAYLDSAASAQKPRAVIDAVAQAYERDYANVHRGLHVLSQRATDQFEAARATAADFLGASSEREIVFVRGTTEAVNLVARSFLAPRLGEGDEILVTALEHHSNLVPWQLVAAERGATIRVAPLDEHGDVSVEGFAACLSARTRMVAMPHVSNALGTVVPVAELVEIAHRRGIPVLVDGAQAAPHIRLDVQALGCDFYAFSGHKAFGPTGIGVLWGRAALLAEMPPWEGGGEMIESVSYQSSSFREPPARFEAGTPNIAGAIGFAAALRFLGALDRDGMEAHEHHLVSAAVERLRGVPGLRLIGEPRQRAGAVSFVLDYAHPHDIGTILDSEGVAVRAGHHCAQPLMERLGLAATVRASFALYNNQEDVDRLVAGLERVREVFA